MKIDKKELRARFHRELIVDAAEKLFLQNGVEKTVMDEIAREAGYSKATVYVYFKSKEEIFDYVILRGMELLTDHLTEAARSDRPFFDRFLDVCFAHVRFQEEYPLHYEAVLGKINAATQTAEADAVGGQIYQTGERLNSFFAGLLADGVAIGAIRGDLRPFETIFTLWAGISGVVRIAAQKTEYIEQSTGKSKEEFLRYGFSLLYGTIALK